MNKQIVCDRRRERPWALPGKAARRIAGSRTRA